MVGKLGNIINVRLGEKSPRVCDYCNTTLAAPLGIVVKTAFLTDYGMMCRNCIKGISIKDVYLPGENISKEIWYKKGDVEGVEKWMKHYGRR